MIVENTQPPIGTMPTTGDLRTSVSTFVKMVLAQNPETEIGLLTDAGAVMPAADLSAAPATLDEAIKRLAPAPQTAGVLLEALADAGQALTTVSGPRRAVVTVISLPLIQRPI